MSRTVLRAIIGSATELSCLFISPFLFLYGILFINVLTVHTLLIVGLVICASQLLLRCSGALTRCWEMQDDRYSLTFIIRIVGFALMLSGAVSLPVGLLMFLGFELFCSLLSWPASFKNLFPSYLPVLFINIAALLFQIMLTTGVFAISSSLTPTATIVLNVVFWSVFSIVGIYNVVYGKAGACPPACSVYCLTPALVCRRVPSETLGKIVSEPVKYFMINNGNGESASSFKNVILAKSQSGPEESSL